MIDDESAIRNITHAILVKQGYDVLLAAGGAEALSLFARHSERIVAVITDHHMPGMDGLTVARTLRKMKPQLKIILSTGRDEDCESEEVARLGINAGSQNPSPARRCSTSLIKRSSPSHDGWHRSHSHRG